MSAVPPKPAAAPGFRPTPELVARIDACLAVSGETRGAFYQRALEHEVETREAAREFRRALGIDAPAPTPARPAPRACSNGCGPACATVAAGVIGSEAAE